VDLQDERELIARAREGDRTAFEAIVRRHDRAVLRLARSLTRSDAEAQDLYQETFLRMFRALGSFRHDCSVATWIHRIAANACLDHLRRAAARPEDPYPSTPGAAGDLRRRDPLEAPDPAPGIDPERAAAGREIRDRIDAALETLPPRERVAFRLRHDDGLRCAAIADILETSEETVRNCLYRAHARLRSALADLLPAGVGTVRWPALDRPAGERTR
jgi:RNA polymerase sigma-70 factor (ECF subfamily)